MTGLTVEHTFDSVQVMELVLDLLDLTVDELGGIDVHALSSDELAAGVVRVQRTLDRLRAAHARLVVEADRARVWSPSGAKNMSDWLAGTGNTSKREAAQATKLGETMDRHRGVADAVADGEMSAATADAIADALNDPPQGADPDELIERTKGVGPVEACRRVEAWRDEHRAESAEETERVGMRGGRSRRVRSTTAWWCSASPCPSWRPRPSSGRSPMPPAGSQRKTTGRSHN